MKMNSIERRAAISLASVLSLRMLGLFMVLPLFSLYASQLAGATPFLIGLAMGIYGLTQALFQIPFGLLSDQLGRRTIIVFGLFLFILGSLIAATADTIGFMMVGRALQGMGAVGGTIMAMIADLTRPEQRTKAMAIAGIMIGFSFSLAMMLGPLLATWMTVRGLFWMAAFCSGLAILFLFIWVPKPPPPHWQADVEPELHSAFSLIKLPLLQQLNLGIFLLHVIFTASFVVIPIALQQFAGLQEHQQGLFYLPVLLLGFILCVPFVLIAEKKHQLKQFFIGAVFTLGISESLFWLFSKSLSISALSLVLFFAAFSLLEAFLPSFVSRAAPHTRKGTTLGLYSCSQFLGIFVGGTLGGWLYGHYGLKNVYLFCVILTLVWVMIATKMNMGEIYHGKRQC